MKKIAFIISNFNSGGVQVALINLLKKLEKRNDLDITLFVFKNIGIYANDVPKNIKVIEIFKNDNIFYRNEIKYFEKLNLKDKNFKGKFKTILYKTINKANKELVYKLVSFETIKIKESYDYAIDFFGYGNFTTYYILNCINAKNKITFIHAKEMNWIKPIENTFLKYDKYCCVSKECKDVLSKLYPQINNKIEICRNTVLPEKIKKLSNDKINDYFKKGQLKLMTIGRLAPEKGYDLVIEIAEKLNEEKIDYKWYIIGTGKLKETLLEQVSIKKLEKNIEFLGVKKNPYPYLKKADIYIQPSRNEGYGIALAEAKILQKLIIASNIESFKEQIVNKENGILCYLDSTSFVKAIKELINDKTLCKKIVDNLKKENLNDNNDFEKIVGLDIGEKNEN